jgi:hypothetical protein
VGEMWGGNVGTGNVGTDGTYPGFFTPKGLAGWPSHPGCVFLSRNETEGAPSLRSLQGRDAMLLYHSVMPLGLHRYYGADHLHFITCSCYRRTPLLRTAGGRDRFLSILEQTRQRYRFVVVGYVIMPEHSSSAQ